MHLPRMQHSATREADRAKALNGRHDIGEFGAETVTYALMKPLEAALH